MLLQPKEAEEANKVAAAAAALPLPPDSDEEEAPLPPSAPANGFASAPLAAAPALTSAPEPRPFDPSFLSKPAATSAPPSFNFGGPAAAATEPGAQPCRCFRIQGLCSRVQAQAGSKPYTVNWLAGAGCAT